MTATKNRPDGEGPDKGAGMPSQEDTDHPFTLRLSGDVGAKLDDLYEAGCSDATFGSVDGVWGADFDREGASFEGAVASAVADVGKVAGVGVEDVASFARDETPERGRGE